MSELAEIIARHHLGLSPVAGRCDVCDECGRMWPCDAAQLAARVAELEAAIRAVQADHVQDEWVCRSFCRVCSRKHGLWPCPTRVELDAVLPPEEQG